MNTKLMMLCFALLFSSASTFAQKSQGFTLTGQFKGLPDGTKVYLRTQEQDTVAKAISTGDRVVFKGKLPLNGRFHFIVIDTLVSKVRLKPVFLENEKITISGTIGREEVFVAGSQAQSDYEDFQKSVLSVKDRKIQDSVALIWFDVHTTSLSAPWYIMQYPAPVRKQLYDKLSPSVKVSYYGMKIKNMQEGDEIRTFVKSGNVIPDFMLATPDGKKVSMLEIASKNKYTLVDFWASWCAPCRAEVPALKNTYADFKDKGFGVMGISSDKDLSKWKKAIAEDATPWAHLVESDKREITNTYDLRAIPAYMLIDDKGRLVAFDCLMAGIKSFGPSLRGEGLKKTLESLLRK